MVAYSGKVNVWLNERNLLEESNPSENAKIYQKKYYGQCVNYLVAVGGPRYLVLQCYAEVFPRLIMQTARLYTIYT